MAIESGIDSKIRELAGVDLDKISIELIAQAAREDDSLAYRVLQKSASYIGIALANLVNLMNPRVMIFGGALFREVPQLLADPLRRIIKQRSLERSANEVELQVSALGSEASAMGAARLIAEKILDDLYLHWTSNHTAHSATIPAETRAKRGGAAILAEDNMVAG
jgi:glucokinase